MDIVQIAIRRLRGIGLLRAAVVDIGVTVKPHAGITLLPGKRPGIDVKVDDCRAVEGYLDRRPGASQILKIGLHAAPGAQGPISRTPVRGGIRQIVHVIDAGGGLALKRALAHRRCRDRVLAVGQRVSLGPGDQRLERIGVRQGGPAMRHDEIGKFLPSVSVVSDGQPLFMFPLRIPDSGRGGIRRVGDGHRHAERAARGPARHGHESHEARVTAGAGAEAIGEVLLPVEDAVDAAGCVRRPGRKGGNFLAELAVSGDEDAGEVIGVPEVVGPPDAYRAGLPRAAGDSALRRNRLAQAPGTGAHARAELALKIAVLSPKTTDIAGMVIGRAVERRSVAEPDIVVQGRRLEILAQEQLRVVEASTLHFVAVAGDALDAGRRERILGDRRKKKYCRQRKHGRKGPEA